MATRHQLKAARTFFPRQRISKSTTAPADRTTPVAGVNHPSWEKLVIRKKVPLLWSEVNRVANSPGKISDLSAGTKRLLRQKVLANAAASAAITHQHHHQIAGGEGTGSEQTPANVTDNKGEEVNSMMLGRRPDTRRHETEDGDDPDAIVDVEGCSPPPDKGAAKGEKFVNGNPKFGDTKNNP